MTTPRRANRRGSVAHRPTPADAGLPVKPREDADGCGCLACRRVDTATTRRSLLDALGWVVHLFRTDRSVAAFVVGVVCCTRLLAVGLASGVPARSLEPFAPVVVAGSALLVRATVGTVVAGALIDDPATVWTGVRRGLVRAPAVVASLALAVSLVVTVAACVSLPVLVAIGAAWALLDPVGPAVAVAAAGVAFFVPVVFGLSTFWLAPEACVLGGYGPVASLRVSWRLTTHHRRKLLLVVGIVLASTIGLYLPDRLFAVASTPASGPLAATLEVTLAGVEDCLSALWTGVYAHLYVQGAVSPAADR